MLESREHCQVPDVVDVVAVDIQDGKRGLWKESGSGRWESSFTVNTMKTREEKPIICGLITEIVDLTFI